MVKTTASQGHEMYCHELEVMGSNPSRVELWCVVFLSKSYFNITKILVCGSDCVSSSSGNDSNIAQFVGTMYAGN